MEGSLGPLGLGLVRVSNFLRDVLWGISENSIQVVCGGRVISSDVFPAFERYRGEQAVGAKVRLERGFGQLLCYPCFFDLLRVGRVPSAREYTTTAQKTTRTGGGGILKKIARLSRDL